MNAMLKPQLHNQTPHRSTTTFERYYHMRDLDVTYDNRDRVVTDATFFVRQDKDGKYYLSVAECDSRDQFCRKRGRTIARRKWFQGRRIPIAEEGINFETILYKYMHENWVYA